MTAATLNTVTQPTWAQQVSEDAATEAERFKAATREQWEKSAKGWNDNGAKIGNWLRAPTATMLDQIALKRGERVLDIAAGAGDQTLAIAERVSLNGSVLATDLSPAILKFAKENARRAGYPNVETLTADGEDLPVTDASFDAAICRLGLMLYPNPSKGVKEMHRALKPGGRACTLVFSSPERNPLISIVAKTALKHAGLPPRNLYQPGALMSLGKPALIDALFLQAGFSDVETTAISAPWHLPSGSDYLDFVRTSAGPIQEIVDRLPEKKKAAVWSEIETQIGAFNQGNGWIGPNELLLTVGWK